MTHQKDNINNNNNNNNNNIAYLPACSRTHAHTSTHVRTHG